MSDVDKEQVEGIARSSSGFDGASALQIRLDTEPLLSKIEFFLRGLEVDYVLNKETGQTEPTVRKVEREQKLNEKGIYAMLNYCRGLINSQTVQGNYVKEDYLAFIIEKRIELTERLIINFYEWNVITEETINEITDFIMNIVEPFLSRTIDNKERDSYGQTMKTVESNRVATGGGFPNIFGGQK